MGKIGDMVGKARSRLNTAYPSPKVGGAALGAAGIATLLGVLAKQKMDERERIREEADRQLLEMEKYRVAREGELRRREVGIQVNLQNLAATNPELYNRISAGRRLPQGAVVIGGSARTDLLRDLAERMTDGDFSEYSPGMGP